MTAKLPGGFWPLSDGIHLVVAGSFPAPLAARSLNRAEEAIPGEMTS
jgi:hypothetical protein